MSSAACLPGPPARAGALAVLCLAAASVPSSAARVERARYLMGSACRIVASHRDARAAADAIEAAFAEIDRWNGILSDWTPDSELSRLNGAPSGRPFLCSADLFTWLNESLRIARETDGAFDPTAGALVDLYALRNGGRWPAPAEIASVRGRVGFERIRLDPRARTATFLAPGMRLDPGADGKGFALDRAGEVLRDAGVDWALVDFGRQILAVGGGPDGSGFLVELPGPGGRPDQVIRLRDASISTTSNAERGLVVDGRPMGHVLDPRTALPVSAGGSVSVVAAGAARADALSTAFFVMGPGEAIPAARRLGVEARFVPGPAPSVAAAATPGFAALVVNPAAGSAHASPASPSGESEVSLRCSVPHPRDERPCSAPPSWPPR